MRTAFLLLICLGTLRSSGQTDQLRWYAFESVVPLTHLQSKELIEVFHAYTGDSILQYNSHNDRVILATRVVFSSDELIAALNELGYYVADISRGKIHEAGERLRTGWYFQSALCASDQADVTLLKQFKLLELTAEERLALGEKRVQLLTSLNAIVK